MARGEGKCSQQLPDLLISHKCAIGLRIEIRIFVSFDVSLILPRPAILMPGYIVLMEPYELEPYMHLRLCVCAYLTSSCNLFLPVLCPITFPSCEDISICRIFLISFLGTMLLYDEVIVRSLTTFHLWLQGALKIPK